MFLDVLLDSVKDTLELVPFLFLTYLAMEALEHGMEGRTERIVADAGKTGPLVGALLGALPQCGFSAMAATLYAGRVVTAGTLVAVILSTSDEMVPVFIAHQEPVGRLMAIIGFKVVVGIVVGFAVDFALRAMHRAGDGKLHIAELCERDHCACDEEEWDDEGKWDDKAEKNGDAGVMNGVSGVEGRANGHVDAAEGAADAHAAGHHHHGHHHTHHAHHGSHLRHIARSALVHTAEVTVFIFLVTLAFGLVIEGIGSDAIGAALAAHPVRGTLLAALVGLIPNCGASVALTELYLDGTLPCGQMISGLLVSGGVGLLVLFRTNADLRQNLIITAFIYAVGVAAGLAVGASGILL